MSIHNGYSKIVQSFERGGGQNLKIDDVILGGGLGMNMVDDGGGEGVNNGWKSDDIINGRSLM